MKTKKNMKIEKKFNNEDMITLGIVAVVILLLGTLYVLSQNITAQTDSSQTNKTDSTNNLDGQNKGEYQIVEETGQCKIDKVYFIYSDWCSYCQKMKPLVEQLTAEGYEFIKVNSQDSASLNNARTCLNGIAQFRYIPEFVCIGNKQNHVGEFASIDEMRAFALECDATQ